VALTGPAAPSCAHLTLFLGLRGDREELGLPASNYWISPERGELGWVGGAFQAGLCRSFSLPPPLFGHFRLLLD
jgi:hypothetical protein